MDAHGETSSIPSSKESRSLKRGVGGGVYDGEELEDDVDDMDPERRIGIWVALCC